MADGFSPPAEVRANAKRGLELRKKYNRGGTEVGVARARDLSNGATISLDTVKRMVSYFARHEVDKQGEGWGKDSAGYIAWLLWGGDAGRAWANRIAKENEKKDKATMADFANAYAAIIKADKNDDGTLTVYGKATDDSIDMDQQICDPAWLDRAMPEWFKSGGNIREQHSQIAAGVAKEYEAKTDGHYISALVVDPVSVRKVETGVLRGFSIGIKSPRVVRDTKAANGRIIDGQIIEVSLVDRPANPNAKLIMAKSIEGESSLVQVEELHEYKAPLPSNLFKYNENHDEHGRFAEGGGGSSGNSGSSSGQLPNTGDVRSQIENGYNQSLNSSDMGSRLDAAQIREDAHSHVQDAQNHLTTGNTAAAAASMRSAASVLSEHPAYRDAARTATTVANGLSKTKSINAEKGSKMETIKQITELAKSLTPDSAKFDQATFDTARRAIAELIVVEAKEMAESGDETYSLTQLVEVAEHLMAWYNGEAQEGETMSDSVEMSAHKDPEADTIGCDCEGCKECAANGGCDSKMCKMHKSMKSINKCLECGCHNVVETHGATHVQIPSGSNPNPMTPPANVTTAEIIDYTKSADADETVEAVAEAVVEAVEEAVAEATEEVSEAQATDTTSVEDVVEKAVKSAMASVKAEIDALRAEKESAVEKSVILETELATALTKTVAGGPKRTAVAQGAVSNEYLVKAATYKSKADATTDPVLRKGYSDLAQEFFAKAKVNTEN